jgi:Asp/Glu/hydantoin racemase
VIKLVVIGPTSLSWSEVAKEVEVDLRRMRRDGVEVSYRCTGAGPVSIRSEQDAIDAAPHVVRTVVDAATQGFDGVIVDCTEDPGVVESRLVVSIPVIGAGEALKAAIDAAPPPVRVLSGDALRTVTPDELLAEATQMKTIAFAGTGHSHLADVLAAADHELTVIEPLDAALAMCLATLKQRSEPVPHPPRH